MDKPLSREDIEELKETWMGRSHRVADGYHMDSIVVDSSGRFSLRACSEEEALRDLKHESWVDLQRTKAGSEKLRDILARLEQQAASR